MGNTWFEGTAYAQRYTNPIIVAGMLIYMEPFESNGVLQFGGTGGDTVCVDLYTGQEIWRNPTAPAFSFAYVQDMENPDFHGVRSAYLCTSNLAQVWDAATGKNVFNCSTVPGGTTVVGPNGEVIKYNFFNNATGTQPQDYYLTLWNSSRIWQTTSMNERAVQSTTTTTYNLVNTTYWENNVKITKSENVSTTVTTVPLSRSLFYENLTNSPTQNVSISWRNNQAGSPSIVAAFYGDMLLCRNGSYPSSVAPTGNTHTTTLLLTSTHPKAQ